MSTFSRRKLFNALTVAAGGIGMAAVSADHVVARVFDDQEYLNERKERLAAHAAHMKRIDEIQEAARLARLADQTIIETYSAAHRHAQLIGRSTTHVMPMAHYEVVSRHHMIDFVPDAEGKIVIPTFLGSPVKLVG